MLRNIFEVLSRAWSEISQLQGEAEPPQMLGGALLPFLALHQQPGQPGLLLTSPDRHGQHPAPSSGCPGVQEMSPEGPWR